MWSAASPAQEVHEANFCWGHLSLFPAVENGQKWFTVNSFTLSLHLNSSTLDIFGSEYDAVKPVFGSEN